MLRTGVHFSRKRGDDRFYTPVNRVSNRNHNNGHFVNQRYQKKQQFERSQSDVVSRGIRRDKTVISDRREPANRAEETQKPESSVSNVERFLEAVTPSVNAQYLSKTAMRGLKTGDGEFQPYFILSDLWESFKEWSAYGVGVPLIINDSDSVVQYYVPYLSGIQLFVDPSKSPLKSRQTSEGSDGDYFSRDSSSDGSSDSERDRGLMYSIGQQNHNHLNDISLKMERLLPRHQQTQEDVLSDEGECMTSQGSLLFQYLEHGTPYGREPLADKISILAFELPELKTLCSCDLLPSSWFSVAWYPIYRIPTGPTLKDLDACFLTYHCLHTPIEDAPTAQAPVVMYPSEIDGVPRMSLPVFGLASYKFRGPLWSSSEGSGQQLVSSLMQAADSWLRLLQVSHPDYLFFCRNR